MNNPLIEAQLAVGSNNFTIPFWLEDGENDPDITSDNPAQLSTPLKITARSQVVRKSFLHQSWSEMNLASELAGADALARIQERVMAYWNRVHVAVDDNLTVGNGTYVTILFGPGAVGFGVSQPNTGYGTEIWRVPSAGMRESEHALQRDL